MKTAEILAEKIKLDITDNNNLIRMSAQSQLKKHILKIQLDAMKEGARRAAEIANSKQKLYPKEESTVFSLLGCHPHNLLTMDRTDFMSKKTTRKTKTRRSLHAVDIPQGWGEKWEYGKADPKQREFVIMTGRGEFVATKESKMDAARIVEMHNRGGLWHIAPHELPPTKTP